MQNWIKRNRASSLALILLLGPFTGAGICAERIVILLSVDGVAASYLPDKELPTISKLIKQGAYASMEPVFPSLTFPNHTTLATGCFPGKHGIVANRFIDKKRGYFEYSDEPSWMECEPLWATAERQQVKTAVGSWPLSYGKWNGVEASYHEEKFDPKETDKERFRKLLFHINRPISERPKLFMNYFLGPDAAGHKYGPKSIERRQSLIRFDRQLGAFLTKLQTKKDLGPYSLLLVSDHGMTSAAQPFSIENLLKPALLPGVPVVAGPVVFFYLWNPSDRKRVAPLFDPYPAINAIRSDKFPKEWGPHHRRMGDVLAVTHPPHYFVRKAKNETFKGEHGYDPKEPSMATILVAYGDGIKKGITLENVKSLQIAATAAALLNISAPKDGEKIPLQEMFAPKTEAKP